MNKITELINNLKNPEIWNEMTNNLKEMQEEFLESTLGQVINNGIDVGLKAILPDWIENDIIDIKDTIINEGFKEGLKLLIDKSINIGKSIEGILTGNFESISEIKSVIKSGGLIDGLSDLLDKAIDWAKDNKKINSSTAKIIKSSKNEILKNIEINVDNNLEEQVNSIEKIDSYIEKWTNYYNENDITNMKKIHTRLQNEMKKIMPIQDILEKVEKLENLHQLIINNGGNFNISEEELELANMLVY